MKLPFLKNQKLPRIATSPPEEKLISHSADDALEDHCIGELMDACLEKNVSKFRAAVSALVSNCFEEAGGHG